MRSGVVKPRLSARPAFSKPRLDRQLDYIAQNHERYYSTLRPHQGLNNRPPAGLDARSASTDDIDPNSIQCRTWLGGLLKHYYRQAA